MMFHRLDAVRGAAAAYVFVGHTALAYWPNSTFTVPFRFGQEAVIVFFVLSGFVIQWSQGEKTGEWGRYFLKRFVRIYSVWVPAVLALAVITSLEHGGLVLPTAWEFTGNALMLQDVAALKPATIVNPLYGDSPLWSLHYEWWFYMLFPLVALVPRGREHVVGVTSVLASCAYAIYPNAACRLLAYYSIWWIGVHAAAKLRKEGTITLRSLQTPLAYVAAATAPLVVAVALQVMKGIPIGLGVHPILEPRHFCAAVVIVLVAFAWRKVGWIGFSKTVGPFAALAPISYSLYVLHYASVSHASYLGDLPSWIALLVYTLTTFAFCWLVEVWMYPRVRRFALSPVEGPRAVADQVRPT